MLHTALRQRSEVGLDGAILPGCNVFGKASSLAYRASDDAFFLAWELRDTLLAIDASSGDLRWEWGGDHAGLFGTDSFVHAHLSDVGDGSVRMFDNRLPGEPSRLVEYTFDDQGFEPTWVLPEDQHRDGPGDLGRLPGCDNLLASWPAPGRIAELDRDGVPTWDLTVDAEVVRAEWAARWREVPIEEQLLRVRQ